MNKHVIVFGIVVLNLLQSFGQTIPEIAKIGINSTVSIVAFDQLSHPLGYGSGFIFDDELIVTNVHVIEGSHSASIFINGESKKYTASGYVAIDGTNDLVILKVPGLYGTKLPLASESLPEIGERIYAIGNPKGFNGTFSEGIVSGIREILGNYVLQITAPISPGSSGGPVINSLGQVIGVAFASFSSGQNLNFTVPVKYLLNLKTKIAEPILLYKVKPQTQTNTSVTSSIKEGVSIRNLELCASRFDEIGTSFSIKNNLSSSITDVAILFLGYDAMGEIIDYFEFNYGNNIYGEIQPFLAKSISCPSSSNAFYREGFTGRVATVKARVLDFKIIEE